MRLRVSLVEDDPGTRDGLARLITRSSKLTLVASYGSAEEALEKISGNLPDVLLQDIQLPGQNGVTCTAALKAAHPGLHILILTTYDDSDLIFEALRVGANGYLLKRSRPAELIRAIEEVHAGGAPMSPHIARMVVAFFRGSPRPPVTDVDKLTPREREVLESLAQGRLYKEIAGQLGISMSTVNTHVESIYRKLHVQTRTEAVLKLRPR
jgi:DNA-binding NarL/FixJ family response regulator